MPGGSAPIAAPVYRVSERPVAHQATLSLRREGPLSQPAVVTFATEHETAIEGDDFREVVGTHTFHPGSASDSASLQIPLIVDDIAEGDESFLVHLTVSGGATLQGARTAQVVIVDDDAPASGLPTVSFEVTGKRRNQPGDFVFGLHPVSPSREIPLRLSGSVTSPITVTAMLDGRMRHFSVDPNNPHWSVGAPARMFEMQLVGAQGARIGEPSRVLGLVGQDDTDFVLFDACVNCDYLYWLYDARFSSTCPDCQGTCQLPPYPGRTPVVAQAAVIADPGDSLPILRDLRDDVMSQTATGRFYSHLYGGSSAELFRAMLASPRLMFDALDAQDPWLEGLQALNDGRGGTVAVTQDMVDDLNGILEGLKQHGSSALRRTIEREEARLDLASLPGLDFDQLRDRVESRGGGFQCVEDETTLCLNGGRFQVRADWVDFGGKAGRGQSFPLTGDTGAFWFFDDQNIELVIKVLDGRGVNGNFWVFYGALSDVEYTITVLDTETGQVATYHNPSGTFGSRGDTRAIVPSGLGSTRGPSMRELEPPMLFGQLASDALRGAWQGVKRGWSRLWAGSEAGVDLLSPRALVGLEPQRATAGSCVATPTQLCLNDDRFRVEVSWRDFGGNAGPGMAAPLTDDTGTFWFFDDKNLELVIKVLDGRVINDRFWVFYGALSNVEYTITVTDLVTGAVERYHNPLEEFGSRGDTGAF